MASKESGLSAEVRMDLKDFYKDKIHVNLIPDMMRTGKKVYDAYFLYEGRFCALEFKLEKGGTFNFNHHIDTRPHQSPSLNLVSTCGGKGYFFIAFNKHDEAFMMYPGALESLRTLYGSSVKYEAFKEFFSGSNGLIEKKKFDGIKRWDVERIVSCL